MRWLLALLLGFFTVAVWNLDRSLIQPVVKGLRAADYPVVMGVLDRCQIPSAPEDVNPEVDFSYHYQVRGTLYHGKRYRYQVFGYSSDNQWALDLAAAHPPPSPIAVHYNPEDAGDAVLKTGLEGGDLLLLLLLLPFNAGALRGWLSFLPGTGFCLWEERPSWERRVSRTLQAGLSATGCLSLPTLLLVAAVVGLHPHLIVMGVVLVLMTALCAWLAGTAFRQPLVQGVVVHAKEHRLTVYQQGQPRRLDFSEIVAVRVRRIEVSDLYEVLLQGSQEMISLTTTSKREQAQKWGQQLAGRLQVSLESEG